ncbi:NHL domain-containing protein isoform 2 [Hibiscus syriacus]|uniref:NHL domain-containing protein isoform 2 n=1 Tax=Hibiscus syriacus TaxID=106335 RepID=A0A6A2ZJ51_HIBSY|nr:NHL domain-containing protein isoform 2 [Hibiscus syriacus]
MVTVNGRVGSVGSGQSGRVGSDRSNRFRPVKSVRTGQRLKTGQTGFQPSTLPAALDFNSAESLTAPPPHAPPSTSNKVDTDGLETTQGTRWCRRCRKRSNDRRICSTLDDEHNGGFKTTIGIWTASESELETAYEKGKLGAFCCSLLVIDRGNRAIREIQLHFDDCAYQYGNGFPLRIAVLVAAGFLGYMLALMQHRVGTIVSTQNHQDSVKVNAALSCPSQKPLKSVRPPLILTKDEQKKQEGFLGSLGKSSTSNNWSTQCPGLHKRAIHHQLRQSRAFYSGWDDDMEQQQKPQHLHHRHQPSTPRTCYQQKNDEKTNEIVFGAVQDKDGKREAVVVRPIDYDHHDFRFRSNLGYNYGY